MSKHPRKKNKNRTLRFRITDEEAEAFIECAHDDNFDTLTGWILDLLRTRLKERRKERKQEEGD